MWWKAIEKGVVLEQKCVSFFARISQAASVVTKEVLGQEFRCFATERLGKNCNSKSPRANIVRNYGANKKGMRKEVRKVLQYSDYSVSDNGILKKTCVLPTNSMCKFE